MSLLAGKRIVLGVTGGVAAYKAAELARLFVKAGARVDVVLTEAGAHFVGAATFQAITGHAVWSDLWDARMPNGMAHIDLSRGADAILIAPASADTLARLAQGRSDDLLTTLCLARDCPLLVAPAMNRQMWENLATAFGSWGQPRAHRPAVKSAKDACSRPKRFLMRSFISSSQKNSPVGACC
jgi:phosphopantothenoylcysteine decarboxylase/phosphopantothenate--cysteine ligase